MNLIVVEDEGKVADYLKTSLEAEGHVVQCCASAEELEALMAAAVESPEAIILDRMLGEADGVAYIPRLKKRFPEAQVLVLSAIDLAQEKARALDFGADDYVAKPFLFAELSARLRVLARRAFRQLERSLLRVKDVSIDLRAHTAFVSGARLDLTRKEFQLLLVLSENPGRVYNKFQLLEKVWDVHGDIESNTVEVTIRKLRCKLEEARSQIKISSRRNIGYWIEQ